MSFSTVYLYTSFNPLSTISKVPSIYTLCITSRSIVFGVFDVVSTSSTDTITEYVSSKIFEQTTNLLVG